MMRIVGSIACVAGVSALQATAPHGQHELLGLKDTDNILNLNLPKDAKTEEAFKKIYDHFLKEFDVDTYKNMMQELEVGLKNYKHSNAYTAYKTIPSQPQCDRGALTPAAASTLNTKAMTAFPGGMLWRLFGFDLGQFLFEMASKAAGPSAASGSMVPMLGMQWLSMGAGMIQSLVATAVMIIPRIITGQPLTCLPMLTGHNCFGAVLHPITMSDFVIADVTDSMMDGYISGFPSNYQNKVGKTSDAAYKICAAAYLGMHCSSIFPRCTTPMSEDSPAPVMGRAPMCFHMCISTLVFCPGFWIEDILGPCQMVGMIPMCSMAVWWQFWRLPPQLVSFEDSHPSPLECPKTDVSFNADADYGLYDSAASGNAPIASPFLQAAGSEGLSTGTYKVPSAM